MVIFARTSSMCVQLSTSRGRNKARLDLSILANTVNNNLEHALSNERQLFAIPHCRQTKRTGVGETSYFWSYNTSSKPGRRSKSISHTRDMLPMDGGASEPNTMIKAVYTGRDVAFSWRRTREPYERQSQEKGIVLEARESDRQSCDIEIGLRIQGDLFKLLERYILIGRKLCP